MLFNLIYFALALVVLPAMGYRSLRYGKYRESLPGMLGCRYAGIEASQFAQGSVCIHAVSVGETVAARAMVAELRRLFPNLPLVVTATTETGHAQARRLFEKEAAAIVYYPLDFTWNVRRFHRRFNPRLMVLMEAEIWPNFLAECRRRGTAVALINGRMSDRSFRRYKLVQGIARRLLRPIGLFCMQTPLDALRMTALCDRPGDVHVTGNVKFDILPRPLTPEENSALRAQIGVPPAVPCVVFGSTHAGEEEIALELLDALREDKRHDVLIICPRHPERFEAVAGLLAKHQLPSGRPIRLTRSSRTGDSSPSDLEVAPDVVLLDRMGVLSRAFGLGRIAIIGGSFASIGGHNLLEAAAHGIPVLNGPHMHAQAEIVRLLRDGDAYSAMEARALPRAVLRLLANDTEREALGRRARVVAEGNRGAASRVGTLLEKLPVNGTAP